MKHFPLPHSLPPRPLLAIRFSLNFIHHLVQRLVIDHHILLKHTVSFAVRIEWTLLFRHRLIIPLILKIHTVAHSSTAYIVHHRAQIFIVAVHIEMFVIIARRVARRLAIGMLHVVDQVAIHPAFELLGLFLASRLDLLPRNLLHQIRPSRWQLLLLLITMPVVFAELFGIGAVMMLKWMLRRRRIHGSFRKELRYIVVVAVFA
mmetsp:Transcript_45914/g.73506  ORF Transcript_45914/g.73506 Transcript_45914/m.73506 type:complete len:204 (-) Transcript_45914:938-1549(-)